MTKFKLAHISDCIFIFLFSWLFSFAVVAYFTQNALAQTIISLCLSSTTLTVFIALAKKKNSKLAIKKRDEELYFACEKFFLVSDDKTVSRVMLSFLKKNKRQAVQNKNGIFLPNGEIAFYRFTARPISSDDLLSAYKSTEKGLSVLYFGIKFDDDALKLSEKLNLRIQTVDFAKLFLLLKEFDCLPEISPTQTKTTKKNKLKEIFIASLDKKKAKTFAFYGALTLILSRYASFSVYYIVSGCIFILYAIAIKFFAPTVQT